MTAPSLRYQDLNPEGAPDKNCRETGLQPGLQTDPAALQRSLTESTRELRRQIGRNLLRLRRERRVTLKQLSRRTGLGTHLLDHFELGKSEVELRQLLVIAQALKSDWRDLLTQEGEMRVGES